MKQGRNLSTAVIAVAALLPFLLCLSLTSAAKGQDLFASLDFTRKLLISFRNSSNTKPSGSSNQFLQAMSEVEKAVARARADPRRPKYSQAKLKELTERIKKATNGKSFSYGRSLLGEAIYLVEQHLASSGRRRKRQATPILKALRDGTNQTIFNTLMAVNEETTLIFAIDDTGSMGNDIKAAQDMAEEIITYCINNQKLVDYILSPFNDPEPDGSRVTYESRDDHAKFVTAIKNLSPHDGGDCPEMAFKGISNALFHSEKIPTRGSTMYVFTDAFPKDANSDDIFMFGSMGISINFFVTGTCGSGSIDGFKKVAGATKGQVFHLTKGEDLRTFSDLIEWKLDTGTSSYLYKPKGSRKRSLGASVTKHGISVDDSMERLTITLTAVDPAGIKLRNPSGAIVTSGKLSLSQAAVYLISKPDVGIWTLEVPDSAGYYEFRVSSTSSTNIDFQHYFLFTPSTIGQKYIPITQPISGEKTQIVLTVAGAEKINASSLSLELITADDKFISSVNIKQKGSSHAHFLGKITTPFEQFQLKLMGLTKRGNKFERFSDIIEPKKGVMRTYAATKDFTLGVGRAYQDSVILQIYNAGPTDTFNLAASDSLGYNINLVFKSVKVYQKRARLAIVRLRATKPADIGKTESLFVTAKGQTSGVELSHTVELLILDARPPVY